MAKCTQCGKKVGFVSSKSDFSGNYFCSDECKNKFNTKKKKDKEMKAKGMVKEFKCKCNQCGKVWHYLGEEEKRIKGQVFWSNCLQTSCCLPIQVYSKNQEGKWKQELDKLKKCPKCGSQNISKSEIYYENES